MTQQEIRTQKITRFDPNAPGVNNGQLLGLPFGYEESSLVIMPVPWEVTVSYGAGTAKAPEAIQKASLQVDIYDADYPDGWKQGIFLQKIPAQWKRKSTALRKRVALYLDAIAKGSPIEPEQLISEVNAAGEQLRSWVRAQTQTILRDGKIPALLGGDHSTPLGVFDAIGETGPFGILQIDAHADLRKNYEGFCCSHASIMDRVLENPKMEKLVQVGVRDYCAEELERIEGSQRRVVCFFDADLQQARFRGMHWEEICRRITDELPQRIYVSFDIDGLKPAYCPHTGTPVPGGFEPEEVFHLLRMIMASGKELIGFDLVEVGSSEWDAAVGARILYKLCNLTLQSRTAS